MYDQKPLAYAARVWGPYKIKHITDIEKNTKDYTINPRNKNLSYRVRLAHLHSSTLTYRRNRDQKNKVYEMINSIQRDTR